MNFNFYMPSKLIFGRGSLNNLHKQKFPGKKALIVTESIIKELGYLKMLEEQLNKANISYALDTQLRQDLEVYAISHPSGFGFRPQVYNAVLNGLLNLQ